MLQELKDNILNKIHKEFGICGHCGKKDCNGKTSYSKLKLSKESDRILDILLEEIDKIKE